MSTVLVLHRVLVVADRRTDATAEIARLWARVSVLRRDEYYEPTASV